MSTSNTSRLAEPFILEDSRDDLPFQIHWELDDAPLSVWAFRVYAHLVRRAGKNGEIFPSYQSIGEACFRATYGPDANPKSLRNKAMLAMKELTQAGLVLKRERSRKGTRESDTNVYKLTPRRQWLEEMKVRRNVLETATVQALDARRMDGKASEGGTVGMPPGTVGMLQGGTVGMPRGTVGVPKVISTEVLQSFEVISKEGVITLEEDARVSLGEQGTPAAQPETQAGQQSHAPRSSSENAALETSVAPAPALTTVALLERPAAPPTADAADSLALTEEDFAELLGAGDVDVKAPEQVPPGAAAALAAPSVELLFPVPREDLLSRDVAPADSEAYRAIRAMVGKYKLEELLSELTATGGYSREDWLRLSLSEIAQAREAARSEAQAQGGRMVTFAARALDRLIGAVATQKPYQQAAQQLGAAYVVRPRTEAEPEVPSLGKYEPGARYRPKAGGAEVELVGLEVVKSKITGGGARYRLSDGQVLPMLELIGGFEFLGRANAPA